MISECSIGRDSPDEYAALQEIYNKNGGKYWLNNAAWASERDYCEWYGILCDSEGFVVELVLRNNNVTGEFQASSLAELLKLKKLASQKTAFQAPLVRL